MRIGIPKEIKPLEGRVALIPEACGDLVRDGHEVLVGEGAGVASGFPDAAYADIIGGAVKRLRLWTAWIWMCIQPNPSAFWDHPVPARPL